MGEKNDIRGRVRYTVFFRSLCQMGRMPGAVSSRGRGMAQLRVSFVEMKSQFASLLLTSDSCFQ